MFQKFAKRCGTQLLPGASPFLSLLEYATALSHTVCTLSQTQGSPAQLEELLGHLAILCLRHTEITGTEGTSSCQPVTLSIHSVAFRLRMGSGSPWKSSSDSLLGWVLWHWKNLILKISKRKGSFPFARWPGPSINWGPRRNDLFWHTEL